MDLEYFLSFPIAHKTESLQARLPKQTASQIATEIQWLILWSWVNIQTLLFLH